MYQYFGSRHLKLFILLSKVNSSKVDCTIFITSCCTSSRSLSVILKGPPMISGHQVRAPGQGPRSGHPVRAPGQGTRSGHQVQCFSLKNNDALQILLVIERKTLWPPGEKYSKVQPYDMCEMFTVWVRCRTSPSLLELFSSFFA